MKNKKKILRKQLEKEKQSKIYKKYLKPISRWKLPTFFKFIIKTLKIKIKYITLDRNGEKGSLNVRRRWSLLKLNGY